MKKVIFPLILIQIAIAIFFAVKIYKLKTGVLGEVTFSPIDKKDITFHPDSKLKFFYEPAANITDSDKIPLSSSEAHYTINSDGLNERYEYSVEKPTNACRIITLGDSFTFGAFANTAENYPEKLEDLLRESIYSDQKIEVINLGVGGYDIQYAVERYFLRGEKYNPDIILWLLKNDDFLDIRELTLEKGNYYFEAMGGERMSQLAEVGYFPNQDKALEEFLDTYGKDNVLGFQEKQIKKLVSGFNGKIVFIVSATINKEYEQIIKEFAEKYPENAAYFKLPDYTDDPETKLPDGHPTILGYELIAESIFKYLLEESLIPCN